MKWGKLGCIFPPPTDLGWMASHAALPWAEKVDGDVCRVYFSGRDEANRSHTGYFETDMTEPRRALRVSRQPLLSPGELGAFDDSGAQACWLVGHRQRKYMYYVGWNLAVTVPFRNAVGLAWSDNEGKTFAKCSRGPILTADGIDPYSTGPSCVRIEGGLWRMWYPSCVKWEPTEGRPQHYYVIKYAESSDGVAWRRTGQVGLRFHGKDEHTLSRPSVLKDGETYAMWYSRKGKGYRIGYAESPDGIEWERKDDQVGIDVSESGWDSEMIEYPFVFDHAGERYMLYNGNGYGKTGIGLAVLEQD